MAIDNNFTRATFRHGVLASDATPHIPAFGEFITGSIKKNNFDWSRNSAMWPDLGNKKVGDCAVAAAMHYTQAVTSYCNRMVVATEAEAIRTLSDINGYDPKATLPDGTNPTDIGVNVSDLIAKWITTGFKMRAQTDKIVTAVRVDPKNLEHIKLAGVVFGGIILVADLPIAAQEPDDDWDIPEGALDGIYKPGSWARHCVYCPVFDDTGGSVITWGESQSFTNEWWMAYGTEVWAIMSPSWFVSGKCVSGYNYDAAICVSDRIRKGS